MGYTVVGFKINEIFRKLYQQPLLSFIQHLFVLVIVIDYVQI